MKQRTCNDYLCRIDRAIALLEQVVALRTELPELSELARAAHFSPCRFHRIYRALVGEAVGRTVMRLRLLCALQCLADEQTSATDALLADWLPESGLAPRDAPLFHHYLDDPEETPAAALRTDIYFPVAEATGQEHPVSPLQAAD